MKYGKYIVLAMLIVFLGLTACGRGKKSGPEQKDEAQPVMVEELGLRDLDEYITVSGKLEGITDITMSSETSGRVLQLYKKLGDRVQKGERIGRVDNDVYQIREEQAQAAFAAAQASFDNAQRNLNYAEESLKRNLISTAEYNNALSAFKGAKANLDGARAGVESARNGVNNSYLSAPEGGVISNLNVAVGQYVAAGQPVASITDASKLIIKTGVGESQISKIKQGQQVIVNYPGKSEDLQGKVRGYGIRPLGTTANYPLEIEISNPQGLLPGMVATAKILSTRHTDLLYTSLTNVSKEFDRNYIYTVDQTNKVHKREVQLGDVIGEHVVIVSGVEIGERIVTSGSENLEEGNLVEVKN